MQELKQLQNVIVLKLYNNPATQRGESSPLFFQDTVFLFFTYSVKSTTFPCQLRNVILKSLKSVMTNTSSAGTSEIVLSVSFTTIEKL